MHEFVGTVSGKGQVTLPADVRRQLGIEPSDKVVFSVDDDHVVLRRWESRIRRSAGVGRHYAPRATPAEMRAAFEQGVAVEVGESLER